MTVHPRRPAGTSSVRLQWLGVGALAVATFTAELTLRTRYSVLYLAAVLLAARFAGSRGIVATALGCAFLAVFGFGLQLQPGAAEIGPGANLLFGLASIAVATVIIVRGNAGMQRIREQASLLDLTHDTIIVRGMDDVIRYWNRGAEELYGWPAELALGKVSHALLQTRFPAPLETINAELAESGRWEGELVHTRRDGSQLVVATRWALQRDGEGRPAAVMATNSDVTMAHKAEYLMGKVFDAAPGGMCVIGPDYRLQRCNPAIARWLGRDLDGLIGASYVELVGGREVFEAIIGSGPSRATSPSAGFGLSRATALSRAFAGQEVSYSAWFNSVSGPQCASITLSPLRPNSDQVEAVLFVVHDQTEEMRAAEALQSAQADLAHANRIATMGQLTASIAHEVSQPLHAVGLSAKAALRWLAGDPPANEEAQDALARVVRNASLAGEVLTRIRNLAKKAPPQRQAFALDQALRDVLALTASEAARTGVTVEPFLAADLPPVFGDRVQLQQVILNLVMNAIEAMSDTPEGPRRVSVTAEAHGGDGVLIRVADTGPGLAPEAAQRVFEPFFTTKPQGMGMGLSICRSIVEAHGGKLSASPNEPGTIFAFTLPAAPSGAVAESIDAEADPA